MAVVKVPKTPRTAFDRNRPPSDLLLKQIEHLEWAALPASQRKTLPMAKGQEKKKSEQVRTEGEAAERVQQLTTMIVEQARMAAAAAPVGEPSVEPAPRTRIALPPLPGKRRTSTKKRSAARRSRSRGRKTPTRNTPPQRRRAARRSRKS